MAVELGDKASGFRHKEVIQFINNEVLQNGGGPDFYRAYLSRPWEEVEDQLLMILADPHIPSTLKRASTWSALALGVRLGAGQQDERTFRVPGLMEHVDERAAASTALSSELRNLREERQVSAVELQATQNVLQQVLDEQRKMTHRMCLLENITVALARSPPSLLMPPLGARPHMLSPWQLGVEEYGNRAMAVPRLPLCEGQMGGLGARLCMNGAQYPSLHGLPSSMVPSVPQPFPLQALGPRRLSNSTLSCAVAAESETAEAAAATIEGATAAPQMPPLQPIYPSGLYVGVGAQEEVGLPYAQRSREEQYPEKPQWEMVESKSCGQEKGRVYLSGDVRNANQKDLEKYFLEVVPGDNKSPGYKEYSTAFQGMSPFGNGSHDQGEGSEMPQELFSQEYGSVPSVGKFAQHLSQEQNANGNEEKKAPEAQHYHPRDWKCQFCKALNFSWRKACYKCKRVCMTPERKCLAARKTE